MGNKTALIAGATGLVGQELLQLLLDSHHYNKVIAMVRSPLGITNNKLVEHILDFDQLDAVGAEFFQVEDVYCCLGTTIKKAKTREAMYRIDVGYPVTIAKRALEQGAQRLVVISSSGADPKASVWYLRMKGELEQQLSDLSYPALSIVRPSLLLGNREEFRAGERMAGWLAAWLPFLFAGPLRKYKPIRASSLAYAMYQLAQQEQRGVSVYSSEMLERLAHRHRDK